MSKTSAPRQDLTETSEAPPPKDAFTNHPTIDPELMWFLNIESFEHLCEVEPYLLSDGAIIAMREADQYGRLIQLNLSMYNLSGKATEFRQRRGSFA